MGVKVGDKVRAVKGTCILNVGDVYEVVDVGIDEIYVNTGEPHGILYYPLDYFKPVAAADSRDNQPKFRVGDRVKITADEDGRGGGKFGTLVGMNSRTNFTEIDVDPPFDGWGENLRHWNVSISKLQPAPLTIQSGKFYKTRDGRKVGPMRKEEESRYWWTPDDVFLWHPDGRVFLTTEHPDDFIAEWTDEPVAAGDSSDNTTDDWYFGKTVGYTVPLCAMQDDAPKFKVGDRVEYDDGRVNGAGDIIEVLDKSEFDYMVRVESKDARYAYYHDGVGRKFAAANLRHVAEATRRNDNEPDANLHVSISLDTSALDAEIDRVKKRLKKLRKRARRMGIALEYSELRDAA